MKHVVTYHPPLIVESDDSMTMDAVQIDVWVTPLHRMTNGSEHGGRRLYSSHTVTKLDVQHAQAWPYILRSLVQSTVYMWFGLDK